MFWGFKTIAEKYGIQQKIGVLPLKLKSKIVHEISECTFCFEHHLAILPTILSFIFFEPQYIDFFTPFMVASLSNTLK